MIIRLLKNVVLAAEAVECRMIGKMVENGDYVSIRNKVLVAYVELLSPNSGRIADKPQQPVASAVQGLDRGSTRHPLAQLYRSGFPERNPELGCWNKVAALYARDSEQFRHRPYVE
jgi:hypothetical protein